MKILFVNLKGGSGKTTLAIHLANYLYYYRNKETCLTSFQDSGNLKTIASLQHCPYPVTEQGLTTTALNVDKEFLVMETGDNKFSTEFGLLIDQCDILITPFQYQLLDFLALKSFFHSIKPFYSPARKYFALPNCILPYQHLKSRTMTEDLIQEEGFILLPPIISSRYISSFSFAQPSKQLINIYRASFLRILQTINYY